MNARQMQYSFIQELTNHEVEWSGTSDDVFYWINKAQEVFIDKYYGRNNFTRKGFEDIQKRTDEFRSIIKHPNPSTIIVTVDPNDNKRKFITLPERYRILLSIYFNINKPDCPVVETYPTKVEIDDLTKVKSDPFNKPKDYDCIYYIEEDRIVVETTSRTTISNVNIIYLINPKKITINDIDDKQFEEEEYTNVCELPVSTHDKIVELAVMLYMSSKGDERINLKSNELNINE